MKTIERLRAVLATVEVAPDIMSVPELNAWCDCRDELINALPALLAVVEAQAAEIAAWRQNDGPGEGPEDLYARCDRTDAALRALEGGD